MVKMTEERLVAWFNGDLADDDLAEFEVIWLEESVFNAIAAKKLDDFNLMTFAEHPTLQ